jgi:hypothetical protein
MNPLVQDATPKDATIDRLMKLAAGGVDTLVALGREIVNLGPRVDHFRDTFLGQLPVKDCSRIAGNYAILVSLAELVNIL